MAAYSDRFATVLSPTSLPASKRVTRSACARLLAAALVLCCIAPAHAAVWRVNVTSTAATPDGQSWATAYSSIQPAVDAAASGDELWVAAGTYTGTGAQVVNLKEGVTLYGGFVGTETARDQRDWKVNATAVDGQQARRCITAVLSSTVDGFTLQNGSADYGAGMSDGTATNCTFTKNDVWNAGHGGGMSGGTATNCVFAGNSANYNGSGKSDGTATNGTFTEKAVEDFARGGGMSDGTATNCVFAGNSSHNYGGGMHGGIATDCTFTENSAGSGAGMSYGTANNCTFTGGLASYEGAGMSDGTATNCTFTGGIVTNGHGGGGMYGGTATNCVFTGNSVVSWGGGMLHGIATDCTFTGNSAVRYGGGMYGGSAANCVFTRNLSPIGGGMSESIATNCTFIGNTASLEGGGSQFCTVTNCILWGNSPTDIGAWSHASYSCLAEATPGVGNIAGYPGFVNPLAGDFRLRAGSPCIDVGTADGAPTSDLLRRTRPQGAGVDMGAYEHYSEDEDDVVLPSGPFRVNAASTAAAPDGLTWETAFPTLQAAAMLAGFGSEIWVAKGSYTAAEGEQVVRLTAGTSVYGGFAGTETDRDQRDWTANRTIIDGQGLRRCVAANTTATVDGCVLQNGGTSDGYDYCWEAMLSGTAVNCRFMENRTIGMSYGTAINCVFTRNDRGGMLYSTAINCTFSGNYGGEEMPYCKAVNCIIWGNSISEAFNGYLSHCCLPAAHSGVGNIVGNPLFVNPSAGDFRLRSDSPCVDSGTAEGAPATDLLGRARPQGAGVDMGAHEHYLGDDDGAVYPPERLRVNTASTAATPDGLTWETAFPTLQAAADLAAYGTEIWVGRGTYTVADGGQVLSLNRGTALYGGFRGTETAREQRDWVANPCIIDGQGVRRCVTANSTSTLDGFTLQNGKSDDVAGGLYGGTAANCLFTGNSSGTEGGGVYFGALFNCIVRANSAVNSGGGMYGGTATNCLIAGNTARSGGGLSQGSAFNCTIAGNSGGGIDGLRTITNCIVWGNSKDKFDGTATYSCLRIENPGIGNIVGDPLFVNPAAGDYRLQPGSPCIGAGTSEGALGADLLGVPRPQGAGVDMGAYEVVVPVTVPDLSGLARAAAKDAIVAAQLKVGAESEEYHPTVVVDHVIRQTPAGGAQSPQWGAVDLVISKGPQPFPAPELVGRAQAAALKAITDAGLVVGKISEAYSATVPVGVVVSQTPAAGETVLPSTAVALVVSRGVQPTAMPDVVGQPRAQAEAAVSGAGLTLGLVTLAHSGTVAAGSVVSQSPAAGSEVPPGTTVSIAVSLGAAPLPEGEGEPVDADTARQQLADAYDTADTNGDGTLSFDEAEAAAPGLTRTTFDALDTNGDGQLDAEELGADAGSGCAGCQGGKGGWLPLGPGKTLGDLFLLGLGLMGATAMAGMRRS